MLWISSIKEIHTKAISIDSAWKRFFHSSCPDLAQMLTRQIEKQVLNEPNIFINKQTSYHYRLCEYLQNCATQSSRFNACNNPIIHNQLCKYFCTEHDFCFKLEHEKSWEKHENKNVLICSSKAETMASGKVFIVEVFYAFSC